MPQSPAWAPPVRYPRERPGRSGEPTAIVPARCRTEGGASYPALCTFIDAACCQVIVGTRDFQAGEPVHVELADSHRVGTVDSVDDRTVWVVFDETLPPADVERLTRAAATRRWESDFCAARAFTKSQVFPVPARKRRAKALPDNWVTLRTGMVASDKRRSERSTVTIDALCRGKKAALRVIIADLSTEGCCILHHQMSLEIGQRLTIRPQPLQTMPAVVQWVSRDFAGLAFETPLHPSVFEHLRVHHASLFGTEPERWIDPRSLPRAC